LFLKALFFALDSVIFMENRFTVSNSQRQQALNR
jgi:hypothetical protein